MGVPRRASCRLAAGKENVRRTLPRLVERSAGRDDIPLAILAMAAASFRGVFREQGVRAVILPPTSPVCTSGR